MPALAIKADQADIDSVAMLDNAISDGFRVLRQIDGNRAVTSAALDKIGRLAPPPVARLALESRRDELAAALAEYIRQVDVLDEASRRNLDNQEQAAASGDMEMAALQGERGLEIVQWQEDNAAHIDETRAALDDVEARIAAELEREQAEQEQRAALQAELAKIDDDEAEQRRLMDEMRAERDAAQARIDADYEYINSGQRPRIFRSL